MVWRTAKMNDSTILQRKNKFKAAWEPKIIYIYICRQVETSFLNCLQQTTNFCPSEIKCKERHLQQIDYFLYSFLPLLPSVGNTHLCYINIQYTYCILYSSSVAIWTCLTNKIKFLGNTNIRSTRFVYVMISCTQ